MFRVLTENETLNEHSEREVHRVFSATGDPDSFRRLSTRFLGPQVGHVAHF